MRVLIALSFMVVALAGCAGDDEPEPVEIVDKDTFELTAGTGAIAGLLVDDRFRPIELTDSPQSEFQAAGFVLLQETGQQSLTNENGEFTFVDLDPGQYTLRVTAGGHEAVPQRVSVSEGVFNEVSVVARRTVSNDGLIISNEYSAFSSCGFNAVVIGLPWDCTFDQSGDTERPAFTVDYTGFTDATHLVMEMLGNNPNYYDVWLRPDGHTSVGEAYQIKGGPESKYLRWQLNIGEASIHDPGASGEGGEGVVWENDLPVQTVLYLNSLGFEEGVGFGAGVYLGVQGNFVQNLFVGEPIVNVDAFCAFCGVE